MAKAKYAELASPRLYDTRVKRWKAPRGYDWELVADYTDATIRIQGQNNFLRVDELMLRIYFGDETPNMWSEDYQGGNGVRKVTTQRDVDYYGESMAGMWIDCDGDVQIERIMGFVLKQESFNPMRYQEYIVMVGQSDPNEDEDKRPDDGFDGFGMGHGGIYRLEKWAITRFDDKDEED